MHTVETSHSHIVLARTAKGQRAAIEARSAAQLDRDDSRLLLMLNGHSPLDALAPYFNGAQPIEDVARRLLAGGLAMASQEADAEPPAQDSMTAV